ncbi:MAG: glycoside hydrolase family 1 protein [Desulfurococcales archaeon]|nr:glycoside hydrolase family 1 protein [Desulfurococcales archaeon]
MLPEGFLWGASSSSFQFEMGDRYRRNIDVNSDWWHWVRDPRNIDEGLVSGDLPEDGVNYAELYTIDHELARSIGLNVYRIHIEWSRVFPCSTKHIEVSINRDGSGLIKDVRIGLDELRQLDEIANQREIRKYRAIINDLRSRGFRVIVNLQHFTLPIWIHDPIKSRESNLEEGPRGVVDESFIVEFTKFAAYVAWKFGDIVDVWSIYNEPMVIIELGYMAPFLGFPPGVQNTRAAAVGLRNIIVAYSRAYDAIKRWDTREAGDWGVGASLVGIIHNIIPAYPLDPERDSRASEAYNYFHNSLILDAWSRGLVDYHLDGNRDRISHIGGRMEWIGLNYYTRIVARHSDRAPEGIPVLRFEGVGGYGYACVPNELSKSGRPCDDFGWEMFPEGFYDAIKFVSQYKLPVYVTENGTADARDHYRPRYIVSHIRAMENAVENGYNVNGYLHWALTDNYEWARGFRLKFGLFSVDLVTKERMPRQSAKIYSQIVRSNGVPQSLLDLSIWDRVI